MSLLTSSVTSPTPVPSPPPVRPGDRIGVAALSGPVDPKRLEAGLRALRDFGFEPVEAANIRRREGLFAGTEDERLDGLYSLTDDPSVKAVLFTRGGWGLNHLLPSVDWDRLGLHPRVYMGYSDLTPFLHGVVSRLGFAAFHGPMVGADLARGLTDGERRSFLENLAGELPRIEPVAWSEPGEAVEGPLLGGCLSLLVSLIGTPWEANLRGSLLFLEDLNEPPYRFDRMLTHLRLSGTLAEIKGLIVGHLNAHGEEEPTACEGRVTLTGLLRSLAEDFSWPLATGLQAGHAAPSSTLPLGMNARLEPKAGRLIVGL